MLRNAYLSRHHDASDTLIYVIHLSVQVRVTSGRETSMDAERVFHILWGIFEGIGGMIGLA